MCYFQLSDMRYSKRMDGSKSFTICGDPLYFSPEIIRQQGEGQTKEGRLNMFVAMTRKYALHRR